jgi:copper resistance protein B
MTQRLIIQPRLATSVAVQKVEDFGVGSGLNNIQLGLRLRYEIKREFAPYLGISWNRKLSETADLAKLEGADVSVFGVVAGVRLWY